MGLVLLGACSGPQELGAAPYAAHLMDARTGETLYAENADTKLHPASLTKMMTLYIAFEEIEAGRLSLDSMITVSANAAGQPPSRLGLKPGQKIALRYLIRAAAVKSANDAAQAIGDAIGGNQEKFAARMTRTAKALGMKNTTFKNANGLTQKGHLSTARDMSILGRHLFYDFPQYYNIFSRRSTDAGMAEVNNTNRRFLDAYKGADGIKTGYTDAAGFNLTASAERGGVRLIATVFGGTSTADRNAKVSELLDLGFRKAPKNATTAKPEAPEPQVTQDEMIAAAVDEALPEVEGGAGKTVRVAMAPTKSPRPRARATTATAEEDLPFELAEAGEDAAAEGAVEAALAEAAAEPTDEAALAESVVASLADDIAGALAEATAAPPPDGTLEAQALDLAASDLTGDTPLQADEGSVETLAATPEPQGLVVKGATAAQPVELAVASPRPAKRNAPIYDETADEMVVAEADMTAEGLEVVTRLSTSGGRHWGVNVGRFNTWGEADRALLKTQLTESATLGMGLRKVTQKGGGFDANYLGLTQEEADLACRRLNARGTQCFTLGP